MKMFDPVSLKLFVSVCDENSIEVASHREGMDRSAVSKRITALEQAVGTRLLERRQRGVAATPAGELFARRARDILRSMEHLDRDLDRPAAPPPEQAAPAGGEVAMQPVPLDGLDIGILRALQQNARLTNAEIGERVGLSASQCSRRRAALEAAGVITGYHASLSHEALGLELLAFVQVRLATHATANREAFVRDLAAIPEVVEAYALAGAWDYMLKIVLPSLARFDELLNTHFLVGGHIAQTQSSFVLNSLKQSGALPLPA